MSFLEMSFSGAVFIFAIAVFRLLTLRRLPKGAFVALWWAAALRLLVPLEVSSRFSVYTLLEALRPKAEPVIPMTPVMPRPMPAQVYIIPTQPITAPQPSPEPFPVWTALWLTVAAALALWALVRYVRWRRRFREALPADCPGLDTCLHSRRKVQLRMTDQIAAPLTYGLLRPVILLPGTLDLSDEEAVTCVLAHEMAHIRRLDGLFKLVLTAALCLHWFNPAAWFLYVLANRDMELRCDEAAVLSLGEDSRERYALALLRMAELRNECAPLCGFSHKSGMEERIRAIMSIKKKSMLACFIALALVLGITTAFATSAKPVEEAEPPVKTREDVMSPDAVTVRELADSVRYDDGHVYFTIPESDGLWNIWISGRLLMEDGSGQSRHYLEEESEKGEWVPRMTYSFEVEDAAYEELTLDIKYGNVDYCYPLTTILPEAGPLTPEPLPEGKVDIPEGVEMIMPVDGGTVTQAQQTRTNPETGETVTHNGMDIAVEKGTPVYAAGKGTVKEAGFNAQDGNFVRLTHSASLETFYAHCQSVEVKTGDAVEVGQTIATVGSTGMSTGPHLHFEFLVNGVATDFVEYVSDHHSDLSIYYASCGYFGGPESSSKGQPIIAAQDGTVLDTGTKNYGSEAERGLYVQMQYTGGSGYTFYNCEKVVVKTGDAVKVGDVIAYRGEDKSGICGRPFSAEHLERERDIIARDMAWAEENLVNGDFPRNSKGETYGDLFQIDYVGHEPDLIAAVSADGTTDGYIESNVRLVGPFDSEEEANAFDNWMKENKIGKVMVPLYNSEHEEIGTFIHGIGSGVNNGMITLEKYREAEAQGWPNSKGSTPPPEREPIFKSIEEAEEAVRNGWVGDLYEGYYAD